MAVDIFKSRISGVPKSDADIVRVDMEQQDIGGRKSHLPPQHTESDLSISHVPSSNGSR